MTNRRYLLMHLSGLGLPISGRSRSSFIESRSDLRAYLARYPEARAWIRDTATKMNYGLERFDAR